MILHAYGMQEHSAPIELTTERVKEVIRGFVKATENAIEAGFDGVEFQEKIGIRFSGYFICIETGQSTVSKTALLVIPAYQLR